MASTQKILLCGDSFAADWQRKWPQRQGWPNFLAQHYDVENRAQAGCSEYRIWQQLRGCDLDRYHAVIVSHTSPNRVYVREHPVHRGDALHGHSDFIYADVAAHADRHRELASMVDYFERWFDVDHARDMHGLICEKIDHITQGARVIHVTHIDWQGLYEFPDHVRCADIFERHRGNANHYDARGNEMVLRRILERLT